MRLLVKFALVVAPSVRTLLDNVGEVLTAAVLYTTPFAESAEPAIPWPPVEDVLLVMEEAMAVVVIVGIARDIPSFPIAK